MFFKEKIKTPLYILTTIVFFSILISSPFFVKQSLGENSPALISACTNKCIKDTGDPGIEGANCAAICDTLNTSEGCVYASNFDSNLTDYSYYDSKNWCMYVETTPQMCIDSCSNTNTSYTDYGTKCSNVCNSTTTATDCQTSAVLEFVDEGVNTNFCNFLDIPNWATTQHPQVTFDPSTKTHLTDGTSVPITGYVESNVAIGSVNLKNIGDDTTSSCTFEYNAVKTSDLGYFGDIYDFTCNSPSKSSDEISTYRITFTNLLNEVYDSERILVSTDITDTTNLIAFWNFDGELESTWSTEKTGTYTLSQVVDGTNNYPASGDEYSYVGEPFDATGIGGYEFGNINVTDTDSHFSFSTNTAHFKVEADVRGFEKTDGNSGRVVGKYNSTNDENTWLLGIDTNGGVYCAVWVGGNQNMIATSDSNGPKLTADQWNTIGCEWDATSGTLKAYLNNSLVGNLVVGTNSTIDPSANYLTIGARPSGEDKAGTLIDNVRIYNLPPSEPSSDNTPPTITIDNPSETSDTTNSREITGDVSDDSGIDFVDAKKVGTDTWNRCTLSDVGGQKRFSCSTGELTNLQTTTFEIRAQDLIGNITQSNFPTYQVEVEVPAAAPVITIDQSFTISNSINTKQITGTFLDADGVSFIDVKRSDEDTWDRIYSDGETSGTFSFWTGPVPDLKTTYFEILAQDSLGNSTLKTYGYQIEVDVLGDMNILGLWRLDDNTAINEELNSDDGVLSAPASVIDGQYGSGLDLTQGQYITVDDTSGRYSFEEDGKVPHFKIEAEIKATVKSDSFKRIVTKNNQNNSEGSWTLGTDNNGGIYCAVWFVNGEHESIETGNLSTPIEIPLNQWNNVGCEWDSNLGTLKVFLNDEIISTKTSTVTLPQRVLAASSSDLSIGARPNGNDSFSGYIDNVKITYESISKGDFLGPVAIINAIENANSLSDTTPTFTGTISDVDNVESAEYLVLETDLLDSQYDIDDYTWTPILPLDNSWSSTSENYSITLPEITEEGVYYLYVRATDQYGNKSLYRNNGDLNTYYENLNSETLMAHLKFRLETQDNSAPIISLNEVTPNPTVKKDLTIKGSVKDYELDTQSAISTIEYKLDNGQWGNVTILSSSNDGKEKDFSISLTNLSVGSHTVSVKATDAAGNITGTAYDYWYNRCMNGGLNDAVLCAYAFNSQLKNNIQTVNFTVQQENNSISELNNQVLGLATYNNIDSTNSTAIIGNSMARLPLDYTFGLTNKLFTTTDEFGFQYGVKVVGVYNAVDGNLWLTFDNGTFAYYKKTDASLTRYPEIEDGQKITELKDFSYEGERYLALALTGELPLHIYSIGTTLDSTIDDSVADYGALLSNNSYLRSINIDNRTGYPSIYASVNGNTSSLGDSDAEVVHIDTKGTISDLSDDIVTLWSEGPNMSDEVESIYFDEINNRFLAGNRYTQSTTFCDDNGTPSNKSDDTYAQSPAGYMACTTKQIEKDENGWYWYRGGCGISVVKINDLEDITSAEYYPMFSLADLGNQRPLKLALLENPLTGNQDIVFTTEGGTIYVLDFNGTYDNLLDDKITKYNLPGELYNNLQSYMSAFDGDSSGWFMIPGNGLYNLSFSRAFAQSAELILLPNIEAGQIETDHVTLNSIIGENTENLLYYVTNDDGGTWFPIRIGETVSFPTSDNRLKMKIILKRANNMDTPEVLGVSIDFAAYNNSQFNNSSLQIDYPESTEINKKFNTEIKLIDELDLTPNWNGTITIDAYNSETNVKSNDCFILGASDPVIIAGVGNVEAKPLCDGSYYFVGTTTDGRIGRGQNIAILGSETSITDNAINMCGDGFVDEGEQCDPNSSVGLLQCSQYDGKYKTGNLTCNNTCTFVTDECKGDTVVDQVKEIVKNIDKDIQSNNGTPVLKDIINVTNFVSKAFSTVLLLSSLPLIPYLVIRILLGLLSALGLKKSGKEYGYVYNSLTKEPIKAAIVRAFDIDGKLGDTALTGDYGEFQLKLVPGIYTLSVNKPGFTFPSKIVTGGINNLKESIYSKNITINDETEFVSAVPVDPEASNILLKLLKTITNKANSFIYILKVLLFVILLTYSIYAFLLEGSLLNILVLCIYILLLGYVLLTNIFRIKYGVVKDYDGNTISNLNIFIKETEFNQLVGERVTDQKGRYRFVIKPGKYTMDIDTSRYTNNQGLKHIFAEDEPTIVSEELFVTKK